jgi:hypothetical protein
MRLLKKWRRILPVGALGVPPSLKSPQDWGISGIDQDYFRILYIFSSKCMLTYHLLLAMMANSYVRSADGNSLLYSFLVGVIAMKRGRVKGALSSM